MNKFLKVAVISAAVIGMQAATMTTASYARPLHRHHGGRVAAGVVAAGVAGLILSEAIRDNRRGYRSDRDYYVSCRRLAIRCDDGSRRACREWRRYCD